MQWMAIFSISDIIIAVTLIVNALALMSSTIKALALRSRPTPRPHTEDETALLPQESSSEQLAVEGRVAELMSGIRSLSALLVFWNIFFFVLMVGVFGS